MTLDELLKSIVCVDGEAVVLCVREASKGIYIPIDVDSAPLDSIVLSFKFFISDGFLFADVC